MKMRERERDRERGGCVTIVSHEIGIIISFTKTMIFFFFFGVVNVVKKPINQSTLDNN